MTAEFRRGDRVIYEPYGRPPEHGTVTKVGPHWIHVRYDHQRNDADGQATPRSRLRITERPTC